MELTTPNVTEVSKRDIENYRVRLAQCLYHHKTTADVIAGDTDLKMFISAYVTENVVNSVAKDAILGIVKKLAHMQLALPGGDVAVFPVINVYSGHNLKESIIFYKDDSGKPSIEIIPMMVSPIIIS